MTLPTSWTREREWMGPAIGVTALSAALALAFIPHPAGLLPALSILPAWMAGGALIAAMIGFGVLVRRRVESPLGAARAYFANDWRHAAGVLAVLLVAGLNMIAFMWVKPLLNYLVPFWADALLARADAALFLGHDPGLLLGWLNFPAAGLVYHQAWFLVMIAALVAVAIQPPSPRKSAALMCYFALWSLAGPLVHIALPAAGPIFYERMGYGVRFAAIDGGEATRAVGDYLWAIYAGRSFGAGSGISAMPSMHVTMAAWFTVAVAVFARGWLVPVAGFAVLIALLSVSLGWHYALDGVVGALVAVAIYRALLALYARREVRGPDVLAQPA